MSIYLDVGEFYCVLVIGEVFRVISVFEDEVGFIGVERLGVFVE